MLTTKERLNQVDEAALGPLDRLGLACCRMNCWQWDELFGPKPEGFDELPNSSESSRSKYQYIRPVMEEISSVFPEILQSRAWWIFDLGKTEEEWRNWYFQSIQERADERNKRDGGGNQKRYDSPNSRVFRFLDYLLGLAPYNDTEAG